MNLRTTLAAAATTTAILAGTIATALPANAASYPWHDVPPQTRDCTTAVIHRTLTEARRYADSAGVPDYSLGAVASEGARQKARVTGGTLYITSGTADRIAADISRRYFGGAHYNVTRYLVVQARPCWA